ncbi:hypothetical protein [Bradyrhizobium sp. 23AC]
MNHLGARTMGVEVMNDGRHLRDHKLVDRPVPTAQGRDANLAGQDRAADLLDPARQTRVDVEQILVEDEIRFEILDLRELDFLRFGKARPCARAVAALA